MLQLFVVQMIIGFVVFVILTAVYYYSYNLFYKLNLFFKSTGKQSIIKAIRPFSIVLLVLVIIFEGSFIRDTKSLIPIFASNSTSDFNDILKKYNMSDYVTPDKIRCSAGSNIIIVSMESLERAFLEGEYSYLTPNINSLKKKWNYFDMNQNSGSSWTSGSLYTYMTGFPAFFGTTSANDIFQSAYYSDISSISHVLKKANYETIYLNGNTDHSGVKEMLNAFKIDKIIDTRNTKKTGYESGYGIRDKDLFGLAKKELGKLKSSNKPFALFISTTDTHFPNGIYDKRMEAVISKKDSDLEFMVAALDYLVGDFIQFLQNNDFLENTVIYLFPDHLKMGDSSMFNNSGKRGLYLLTNSKMTQVSGNTISQIDLPKIILEGANINHNLKFLTNYIKGNKEEYIKKNIIPITEINTNGILNPRIEPINYVSKNYSSYKKDTSRYIAHAGGKVDGHIYTNSLEALDLNYKKGFRLFELDIIKTSEGEYVAAHDWEHWAKITGYTGEIPVSLNRFLRQKLYGKFTPIDMKAINKWFGEHKDAILVTDKINNPVDFSEKFIDKNRLMMELFDEKSVDAGLKAGILSSMPSQRVVDKISKNDVKKMAQMGIKNIAISRNFIANNKEILQEFKKYNIKSFAYHINSKPNIDEYYVVNYEMDYIWGIYADEWNFE